MKDVKWRSVAEHKSEVEKILEGKNSICVFDTETTGLEKDAKIIQFSAIKYEITPELKLKPMASVNTYINPEMILPDVITELTGITQDTVDAAKPERFVVDEVMAILDSSDIWAGQNVNFDLLKIENMCKRTGFPYDPKPSIDTLKMARHLIPLDKIEPIAKSLGYKRGNHKLETITKYLFPNHQAKYHDSMEDVSATAMCLEKFIEMYKNVNKEDGMEHVQPKYAFFWINPNKETDQRIKICLPDDNKTAIYYDAMNHYWTCFSSKADKERFDNLDKTYIEKCVLNRYGAKFDDIKCMEDLAREMRREYTEKRKDPNYKPYQYKKVAPKPVEQAQPIFEQTDNAADIDLW